jgi:uncharacterized membrane protein
MVFLTVFGPRYRRGYWGYGQYRWYGGSAEDILDHYAKGEISRELYLQTKDDLYKEQRKGQ